VKPHLSISGKELQKGELEEKQIHPARVGRARIHLLIIDLPRFLGAQLIEN
jgi:hypothetical protein